MLIVDDNETNRLILHEMVVNWRMRPTAVPTRPSALAELLRARQTATPYRVVLTDVHMPGMDGFQLAESIKTNSEFHGTLILMLTSGDGPGDVERCRKVGGSAHLIKPIKQSELFDAIVASLGMAEAVRPAPQVPSPGTVTRTTRPLRILLAEDSTTNQRLAVGLLSKLGHTTTVASNGQEAVATLEREPFDIVLMDVQMPEMDGFRRRPSFGRAKRVKHSTRRSSP